MSFILLGILNSQAAGAVAGGGDYDLLETTVLDADTASVSFTGLGSYSDYKHLQVRMVARVDQVNDQISLYLNGDTGSNYAFHDLNGNGSSVNSGATTSASRMQISRVAYSSMPSNIFTGVVSDILDPFSTSKNTTVRTFGGTSETTRVNLFSGLWNNTSALTSLEIFPGATNFVTGSRFSLYGLKAGA